jgi:predicted nuclease of predicted toxin-antitoxin system
VSRLFISIYLDEDVSALIAKLLRARAYTVLTTQEAGHVAASDEAQLEYATSQQLAILTHNRDDFLELARQYATAGKHHCGIIIAIRRSPYDIARRLLSLLDRTTADEMDDQTIFM